MAVIMSAGNVRNNRVHEPDATSTSRSRQSHSWFSLLCAAALLLFADGRNTIALAAWLAPALLLRFVRTQPARRGLAIAYIVLIVTRGVAMRGMIPIPGIFYYVFLLISGISALLPYFADRLAAPHYRGVLNTLLFPCTLVAAHLCILMDLWAAGVSIPYTQSWQSASGPVVISNRSVGYHLSDRLVRGRRQLDLAAGICWSTSTRLRWHYSPEFILRLFS